MRAPAGVLRLLGRIHYRPERWTTHDWDQAYATGQLGYFGDVDELARYSVLAGYVRYLGSCSTIVDIGCGDGKLLRHLDLSRIEKYVGVDLSSEAIKQAAGSISDGARFECGDFMELTLEPADIIVLNEVLYFATSPSAMIDRVETLTRAGGGILVSMWRHPGDQALWRRLDARFDLEDRVSIHNQASRLARRGWMVALYRMPSRR